MAEKSLRTNFINNVMLIVEVASKAKRAKQRLSSQFFWKLDICHKLA